MSLRNCLGSKLKRLLLVLTSILILLPQGIAIADDQPYSGDDIYSITNNTPFYDPNANTKNCSTNSPATPGTGAPDGAAFPNLDPTAMTNAIDSWVKQQNPSSELNGLGETIVASAKNSNINPFLIVAIASKESSLADPSDYNVSHGNNAFGREATASQPNFQGTHLWYRWSSVEASVDYTAPENQGAQGGGDMATYLRDQYGGEIDKSDFLSLMEAYAPPSENDTATYIAQVKQWIADLVKLANGSSSEGASDNTCGGSTIDCSSPTPSTAGLSTTRQDVVCIAQQELTLWESKPGYPHPVFSQTGYYKYSDNSPEEWCADFASWVYKQASYPFSGGVSGGWRLPGVAGVQALGEQNGNFHWHSADSHYTPKPGDLAIHGDNHVNIFISSTGGVSEYIGGDQGDGPYPGGSIVSTERESGYYGGGITGYVSPD